jgi:hypothetical protein
MTATKTANIADLRRQIAGKQADLARLEVTGRPTEPAIRRAAELLEDLSEPYRAGIRRAAAAIVAARGEDLSLRAAFNLGFAAPEFAIGAVAALLADRIFADLEVEIDRAAAVAPDPLPDEERAAALAAVKRELLELERREEALIEAERAAGNEIHRRPDADPLAVLGIPLGVCEEFNLL